MDRPRQRNGFYDAQSTALVISGRNKSKKLEYPTLMHIIRINHIQGWVAGVRGGEIYSHQQNHPVLG